MAMDVSTTAEANTIVESMLTCYSFYINFPFCAGGLLLFPSLIRYEAHSLEKRTPTLASIDWIGSALFTTSIALLLVALSWGGNQYAWNTAAIIYPLLLGAAGLVATVFWEKTVASIPIFRPSLFSSAASACIYLCGTLQSLLVR